MSKGNDTAVNLPGDRPAQAAADTKLQLVSAQRVSVEQTAEPVSTEKEAVKKVPDKKFTESSG